MIQLSNLSKKYNETVVLDIPSLSIQAGESFGLVGNNGAGKTTLFRLILDYKFLQSVFGSNSTLKI